VGGFFQSSSTTFGSITLTNPSSPYSNDAYVAKLTDAGATGSFVWAQRAGGFGFDNVYAMAVQGSNVYIAGSFDSSPATFGSITVSSAGNSDVYVAKLVDAGATSNFTWVQASGGQRGEMAYALAVQGANVYEAGYFSSATLPLGTLTVANSGVGPMDGFVAKLTDTGTSGRYVWAQGIGGVGRLRDEYILGVAVSGSAIYITGVFGSPTIACGSTVLTNTSTGINGSDIFVAQLEDAGSSVAFAWAQRAGGPGTEQAIAVLPIGTDVYVTGSIGGSAATFGTLPPLGGPNVYSGFLARLGPSVTATHKPRPATLSLYPNPVASGGRLHLSWPSPAGLPAEASLYTLLGQRVFTRSVSSSSGEVGMGAVPAGSYVLVVTTSGKGVARYSLCVE
jgi:hypothetical protein